MTRTEYFQKQRELAKAASRAEAESARRVRAVTRELVLPLVREYYDTGSVAFPKEELARRIDHIIREEGAKPVQAARKLQEDMEASLGEKLNIALRPRPEQRENGRERVRLLRANAGKKPIGEIIEIPGKGWGYGMTAASAYYRDPNTGKVVWTDLPLEYQFRKRADLSTQVWKAVEEQEQAVFNVIQGGRAAGRNVKDIARDLEEYINYPNGGQRVAGRWMGMFPDTDAGRREALKREYLETRFPGVQYGTDAARGLLKQPDAKAFVGHRMSTAFGKPPVPDAVKQYMSRLGKAGLDYRAIRISRTETTAMLADEQLDIAKNSAISDGKMDFKMERGRDHWNCNCERYAEKKTWDVDDPERPEIPVHPNCMCEWRPHLKTDEEILADFRGEMKEDIETVRRAREDPELSKIVDEMTPDFGQWDDYGYREVTPEVREQFQDMSNQVYAASPEEQRQAMKGYTGKKFSDMNNMLYGNIPYDAGTDKQIKALDKIIKTFKLDKDIISYRGTEARFHADWEAGKTYPIPAFVSTSLDRNNEIVLSDFVIEMRMKKGTRGMYIGTLSRHPTEDEFLLGRGLQYKVVEKTKHSMILEVSND